MILSHSSRCFVFKGKKKWRRGLWLTREFRPCRDPNSCSAVCSRIMISFLVINYPIDNTDKHNELHVQSRIQKIPSKKFLILSLKVAIFPVSICLFGQSPNSPTIYLFSFEISSLIITDAGMVQGREKGKEEGWVGDKVFRAVRIVHFSFTG